MFERLKKKHGTLKIIFIKQNAKDKTQMSNDTYIIYIYVYRYYLLPISIKKKITYNTTFFH